ncbi:hypothetical protein QZH41_005631 [Actinostola sp. cb2023]|nr:hypothetical protein QZH41_005631 [Actinostola sp. cb2023]
MKGRIVVFSITGCPFCLRVKSKIRDQLGLEFVDIDLDHFPNRRNEVKERSGRRTVPQVFFNNIHVGGFEDLNKLSKEELDKLIKEVQENPAPEDAPKPPEKTDEGGDKSDTFQFTCELDEYAELVKSIKDSGLVKDHRQGLIHTYKNSFVGKEVVDWLMMTRHVERDQALAMCQNLIDRHFSHAAKKDDESNALNSGMESLCEPRPAHEVGETLRHLILKLYNSYLSADGKGVDYAAMGESTLFKDYAKHTAELQRVQLEGATREEKLSFFINIYNALVIHATVVKGPPTNLWQRYKVEQRAESREQRAEREQSRAEQSRAEQSRAEQSRAEQSRAEQSRAEQSRAEQSRAEQSRAEQSRAEQSRAEQSTIESKEQRTIESKEQSRAQ